MSDNLFWVNRIVESGAADPQELAKGYNPDNWRHHPQIQRDALEDALDSIGVLQPVLFNRLSGKVIDGHLRIELAILKGQPLIPVNYVELTDDEEALALATLDAITEQAEPIPDKLAALLERTREMTADRPGLGAMLQKLKERAGINGNGQSDNGNEPPIPTETEAERLAKEWQTAPGQVWQLGRHIIACLDSTDEAAVRELIGGKAVGMVWADPPYGINAVKGSGTLGGSTPFGKKENHHNQGKVIVTGYYSPVIGDSTTDISKKAFELFSRFDSIQVWWGANNYTEVLPPSEAWIVWDKENTGGYADCELAWTNYDGAARIFRHTWNGMIKASEQGQRRVHPTQKPVALPVWCFEKYGKPETLIFDPFLGSGISVLAAENLNDGRRVIGCELAHEYIAVVLHRWSQLTGQTPRRVPQGDTKRYERVA